MNRFCAFADEVDGEPCQLVYANSGTSANIENPRSVAPGSQDIGFHSIPDKGEIPGLLAIAKDDRRLPMRNSIDKPGDDGGIL